MDRISAEKVAISIIDACEWPIGNAALESRVRRKIANAIFNECSNVQEACALIIENDTECDTRLELADKLRKAQWGL